MLDVFLCPSDQMPKNWMATNGTTWISGGKIYTAALDLCEVAGSNYVGVFGIGEPGVDGEGVFFRDSFVRPIDIPDGLTHTMAVGERSINLNAGRGFATWVGAVPSAQLWSCVPDPYDPDGGVCRREDGSGMILGHTGEGRGPGDPKGRRQPVPQPARPRLLLPVLRRPRRVPPGQRSITRPTRP